MKYAYLFEARGIQRFLFASGKLRDMLGGSELLDYMCANNGYLDQTLSALKLTGNHYFVRKAGGAFYLIFEDKRDISRFQATWRLACARLFSGVECVDAVAESDTALNAIKLGIKKLNASRNNLSTDLPVATPITERSQRTGRPAVPKKGIYGPTDEILDAATFRQNEFKRPVDPTSPKLEMRFLTTHGSENNYRWPINFEESADVTEQFPLDERRFVGLLHADGNGLGELLRILNSACAGDGNSAVDDSTYIDLYKTFSDGLTEATQQAANDATQSVILKHVNQYGVLPARPLVLGGDDLSILLRADIALEFTKAYLKAFEIHTRKSMQLLKDKFADYNLNSNTLPDYLTACAGLCYMKCNQPFQAGYNLAEGLCSRAKKISRQAIEKKNRGIVEKNKDKEKHLHSKLHPIPASIAFHKIQDSLVEDAKTQYEQSFVFLKNNKEYRTALEAYGLEDHILGNEDQLPSINTLEKLINIFENKINDRPLREIATLLGDDIGLAESAYKRWRKMSEEHQNGQLSHFDKLLEELCGGELEKNLPFSNKKQATIYQSPIADLLTLLTIFNSSSKREGYPYAE